MSSRNETAQRMTITGLGMARASSSQDRCTPRAAPEELPDDGYFWTGMPGEESVISTRMPAILAIPLIVWIMTIDFPLCCVCPHSPSSRRWAARRRMGGRGHHGEAAVMYEQTRGWAL